MITTALYPDLTPESNRRLTGILMAREVGGAVKAIADPILHQMIRWYVRLVDGALIDYQAAREAYYRFYQNETLGGSLPVSEALVPMFHHIENCVSNMERVREMAEAIRTRKVASGTATLIEKNDWKVAEAYEPAIKDLRNGIQHTHNHLKEGRHAQGVPQHADAGEVVLGNSRLPLVDLAKAVQVYHRIGRKLIEAVSTSQRQGAT